MATVPADWWARSCACCLPCLGGFQSQCAESQARPGFHGDHGARASAGGRRRRAQWGVTSWASFDSLGSFGIPRLISKSSASSATPVREHSRQSWAEAPDGFGLLLKLDGDGACWMKFVPDTGLSSIHPNIHAPESLSDVAELGGGGSGVTVVRGVDPDLGPVVFKHGGEKDMEEFFALATIEEELRHRGRRCNAPEAATYMWDRTPDFKFLYISQEHLRNRGAQLWGNVKYKLKSSIAKSRRKRISKVFTDGVLLLGRLRKERELRGQSGSSPGRVGGEDSAGSLESPPSKTPQLPRAPLAGKHIRLCNLAYGGCTEELARLADRTRLEVTLETHEDIRGDLELLREVRCCSSDEHYRYLMRLRDDLLLLQRKNKWKFTMAQKAIGGPCAVTGAKLLAEGRLKGDMLRRLIREVLVIIRHLQKLTLPHERHFVDDVEREIDQLGGDADFAPRLVSGASNMYVGFAINKNFHPSTGRFMKLRHMGEVFRTGKLKPTRRLVLTDSETIPARFLGQVLDRGARMEDVFCTDVVGHTALDVYGDSWSAMMRQVLSLKAPAARERVWTCGVSDGGLHNLFLEEGSGLWLFDMGEPALMPLPAFMTKFLFSFLHALGMEEPVLDDTIQRSISPGGGQAWVNRFEPCVEYILELTRTTKELLAEADGALRYTVNRLVDEVFDGETEVAEVLRRYIILQLLSDASFCMDKWLLKGGGTERTGDRSAWGLEKWLWRALWDLYAAGFAASRDWCRGR